MRYRLGLATALLVLVTTGGILLSAADRGLPVTKGGRILASVNGDFISVDDLELQLDKPVDLRHLRAGSADAKELEVLDRMITIRLIVQEAGTMGLADLPDIRRQVEVTSRTLLREALKDHIVKDVVADEAEVETVVKELTKEWKTRSLLWPDEESAKRAREALDTGVDFDSVAAQAVADKSAKTEGDDAYHGQKDYLPEIAEAVASLKAGEVSPVIRIQAGYVILKVVDIRSKDTPEARAQARAMVLSRQQEAAFGAHQGEVTAKNVVVRKAVLESIDYEAKEPGIDALLKDNRIVADIKGTSPVTVGDLTEYLRLQFFHGGEAAVQAKRMNDKKQEALEATLARRVLNAEALRLKIDKGDAYRTRVRAFEDSLVFDTFVQKVILPDSKMREEEVKSYYAQHLQDYSYPRMVRMRSLGFTKRGAAEDAIEKLRGGTDIAWLAANAEDQVAGTDRALPIPDGRLVTSDSLPDGVRDGIAGSKPGEFRFYASPEGQFYVLAIQDIVPPNPRPYEEVREDIARKLYGEKVKKNVEEYAARLRGLSEIEIHVKKMP